MSTKLQITSDLKRRIRLSLKEDIGRGDISSRLTILKTAEGRAFIVAKETGVVAGLPVLREVFNQIDPELPVLLKVSDGALVRRGTVVALFRGSLRSILAGERVALNFLQHLSGVATLTHAFVEKVKGAGVHIYDTRKTTPLWRDLEKYAVRVGGGHNHRSSLGDAVMIKDTHWDVMESHCERSEAISLLTPRLLRRTFGAPRNDAQVWTTIEVSSMYRLTRALNLTPDLIMFDNWTPRAIRSGVRVVDDWSRREKRKRPLLEASGGITLENVRAFARSGVDRISVGALTHSARALDFSLKIEKQ